MIDAVSEAAAIVQRLECDSVLIVPGYPGGYCPLHSFEGSACWQGCADTRVEFARLARELEAYWKHPFAVRALAREAA